MANLWMELLMGRLRFYLNKAMEQSEYFDFMTLFRRILTNPVLMDFQTIILDAHDLAESNELDQNFHDKVVVQQLSKIDKAFAELSVKVTLDELKHTRYELREENRYSFMEFYWIYLAWLCFGESSVVELNTLREALEAHRKTLSEERPASKPLVKIVQLNEEDDSIEEDIICIFLQKIDRCLITYKESESKATIVGEEHVARGYLH